MYRLLHRPEHSRALDAPCRHLKAPRTTGAGACGASRTSTTGGCADYDNRPTVCRAFLCGWRLGLGEKLDRPDLLGVMIQPTRRSDGAPMLAFVELRPGALDSRRAQALMVHWAAATGDGVTVRRAQSRHFMTLPVTIERKPIR